MHVHFIFWPITTVSLYPPWMTFRGYIGISVEICVRSITFVLPWHWPIILGSWVYHHEKMCLVHSWSWYDVDLWPQGWICRVYDKALCSSHSFFVLWHSHTMFGMWYDVSRTFMISLWPWALTFELGWVAGRILNEFTHSIVSFSIFNFWQILRCFIMIYFP